MSYVTAFQMGGLLLIGFIIWIRTIPLVHEAFVDGEHDHLLLYFCTSLAAALLATGRYFTCIRARCHWSAFRGLRPPKILLVPQSVSKVSF